MRMLAVIGLLFAAQTVALGGDQDKFAGAWKRVSIIDDGKPVDGAEKGSVVFKGDGYTLKEGEEVKSTGTYKLDEAKSPKEFDVIPGAGPNKGKVLQGIYKFDGDKLVYAIAGAGQPRPKEFASTPGSKTRLYTNERVK